MTARYLAQTKLATSLFIASTDLSRDDLSSFLVDWREKLRNQLMYDSDGLIGQKFPSLAKKISKSFPEINVLRLYANPITTWTFGDGPDTSRWRPGQPDLAQIAVLCEKSFSWGSSGHLVNRFQDNLWRGIVVRQLLKV